MGQGDEPALGFGVLGPLEVLGADGRAVDVGGAQPRRVLAVLLAAAGRVVPADSLVDAVWGEDPPASASGTLQTYVSRLRRALADGATLAYTARGYRLEVAPERVDFLRFEALADDGRRLFEAGCPDEAAEALAAAEALWRGSPFSGCDDIDAVRPLAERLEERRLVAREDAFEAELALGRHGAAVAALTELVGRAPLRERLRGQLMLALYRSGRQAEALRVFAEGRTLLVEELGVDPSPALARLEERILAQDPELEPPAPVVDAVAAPPAAAGDGAGLVGRASELAVLLAALDETSTGARMVVVEGEPGIGKTRLVEALEEEAARRGALVVWGRSHEGGIAPAFWPWLGSFRALVAAVPEAAAGPRSEVLAELLDPAGVDDEAAASGATRFALFEAFAEVLARAAEERAVVAVLDDVQWADVASLELLSFLAGRLRDEAVLVVGTLRELELGRTDAVVDALAAVSRRPTSRRLQLTGLDAPATAELLTSAAAAPVSPDLSASIHARADGNPFFAIELARLVDEAGPGDDAVLAGVPVGVRDVVRHRLAALPEGTRSVLQVGAVLGRDVEVELLTRATGRPVDTVFDDLEPALVHRLLVEVPDRPGTFRFAHALVREVLVDDLSGLRRARLHLQAADAVAAVSGDAADAAEIIAEHLWSAAPLGVGRRAAEALERAADVAHRRYAAEAAEDLLGRALSLRRAAGSAPEDEEAELVTLCKLVASQRLLRGFGAQSSELLRRGQELAQRCGRTDLQAEILWAEWAAADLACDFARARPLAAGLRTAAEGTDDPVLRTVGLNTWAIQCWQDGHVTEAGRYLDDAMAGADQLGPDSVSALRAISENYLSMRCFHLHVHDLIGDFPDVDARFDALAEEQTDPFFLVMVCSFASMGALARGDLERAVETARRGVAGDPDGVFGMYGAAVRRFLGAALLRSGDASGQALVDAGTVTYRLLGIRAVVPLYLAETGLGRLALGDLEGAAAFVADARHEVEDSEERWEEPVVVLAEAEVAAARGAGTDEVGALLRQAIDLAREQGSLALTAQIEAAAARLGVANALAS